MEIEIISEEKNVLEFKIVGCDEVLARLLAEKLTADKDVEFAAYKLDHPLIKSPCVVVKTKKKKAYDLVLEKLEEMKDEIVEFKKQFKQASN
ncbi:MAG: RpoL/Rpb11 RNA polymerase subunit family protein [Candidatus Micrarchaeota archaeon]